MSQGDAQQPTGCTIERGCGGAGFAEPTKFKESSQIKIQDGLSLRAAPRKLGVTGSSQKCAEALHCTSSPVYVPFSEMHLIYSRKKGCLIMRLVRDDAWTSHTITVLRTFR